METPNVDAVKEKFDAMPDKKKQSKKVRTLVGIAVCVFGWYAKEHWPNVPDLVTYGTACFGGVTIAGEYLAYPFKLFTAMLKDLHDAVRA